MRILFIKLAICLLSCTMAGQLSTTTSTRTVVTVVTVTESIVAIGGLIQNVQVNLDNGNGHTWDYTTQLVTGEQVITLVTSTQTECGTVYVYGSTTLSTDVSICNTTTEPAVKLAAQIEGAEAVPTLDPLKIRDIMKRFVMTKALPDMAHINADGPKHQSILISV